MSRCRRRRPAEAIIRSGAQQGALNQQFIQQQGLVTQGGYEEQARSYRLQQQAAGVAAEAQNVAAADETQAAGAYQTEANLFGESQKADFISATISGVAELALAPVAVA